jgi:hypothetical protein
MGVPVKLSAKKADGSAVVILPSDAPVPISDEGPIAMGA